MALAELSATKNSRSIQQLVRLIFVAGLAYMLWLFFNSPGTHTHDEIGHYLISRDAWIAPELIFNTWGRTVHTLLYMIPAAFGLIETRLLSVILSGITALITLDVARKLTLPYWYLTPLLLLFQPWFAELSFLTITQVPFSLLMIGTVWLGLKDRLIAASIAAGLLPMVRHEGIALLGLWCLYLAYHKQWRALLAALIPYVLYNLSSYWFTGTLPLTLFFDSTPNEIYGSGAIYHYLIRLPHPEAVGIPLSILAFIGLKQIIGKSTLLCIACWYGSYFLLHTVIYYFGLFASGGYKFFLLPMAPAFACLAALGLKEVDLLLRRFRCITPVSFYGPVVKIGLLITCVGWTLYFTSPHPLSESDIAVKNATKWIEAHKKPGEPVFSNHVYYYHFLPANIDANMLWEEIPRLSNQPAGTTIMWDSIYSPMWGLQLDKLENNSSWKKIKTYGQNAVILFEKQP